MPVTAPVVDTVAIPGAVLDHTPPGVISVRLVTDPTHTPNIPDIAVGVGVVVIVITAAQPIEFICVITEGPGVNPIPVPTMRPGLPTVVVVATFVLLLVHVPEPSVELSVVDPF
jgi:hypothetical protein